MSHRYAGSRSSSGKDHLSVTQDRLPPEWVAQALLLDEMDLAAEDLPQVLLHGHEVEKAPWRVRGEGHQDIDVAVGPKVVAQHRPEEGELRDLPEPAEIADGDQIDWHFGVHGRAG